MRYFTWTVKASKLCNLRCRYCYEWPHLADPVRIPVAGWIRILGAALDYHIQQTAGELSKGLTRFVWHGGEPLSLPIDYWRKVINLQHEVMDHEPSQSITYENAVQTNLFALSQGYLDLFAEEGMAVNVSFDGGSGTRVTEYGRQTEDRVLENMSRLRDRNIPFGANVVLGGHTKDRLIDTYETLKTAGARQMTVVPLIAADHVLRNDSLTISSPQVVTALEELYQHWSSDPDAIPVFPLTRYLRTVHRHQLNLGVADFDRNVTGERRLIVNTDGDLYVRAQQSDPEHRLGNLFRQTLSDIFRAAPYAASLELDKRRRTRVCDPCVYRQACDTRPALESFGDHSDRTCSVALPLCEFIAAGQTSLYLEKL